MSDSERATTLKEQLDKLQEFKKWVHDWVPAVFDRIRALEAELDRERSRVASLERELKLWKPLTPAEAEAALEGIEAVPLDEAEITRIVAAVTDPLYRPTEPQHVLMAAKIRQLEQRVARLAAALEPFTHECPGPADVCRCAYCNASAALAAAQE